MQKFFVLLVFAALVCAGCKRATPSNANVPPPTPPAPPAQWDEKSTPVAEALMKASGADYWPEVKHVEFRFLVDVNHVGTLNAKHDWNVAAGTDTVTWNDKTVTVHLANPNENADTKEAFARWTHDTFWLLAPLKLRDGGVKVTYGGEFEEDDKKYPVLHVSFNNAGLTPGDPYNFYVDPDTHLLHKWDYTPKPGTSQEASWFAYHKFDHLVLSTEHIMGDTHIFFDAVYINQQGPADAKSEK